MKWLEKRRARRLDYRFAVEKEAARRRAEGYWCNDPHPESRMTFAKVHFHPPVRPAGATIEPPPRPDVHAVFHRIESGGRRTGKRVVIIQRIHEMTDMPHDLIRGMLDDGWTFTVEHHGDTRWSKPQLVEQSKIQY